jgi:uncharacterized protein (DUF2384 family)
MKKINLFELANFVFCDKDKAARWMRKPRARFGGKAAIDVMHSEAGAKSVEEALVQIDHGYW